MIHPDFSVRLYEYLCGIIREQGGVPVKINGMPDHVHILAMTPKTIADSDFMRVLKTNSSKWVHDEFPQHEQFGWQTGYGWFSVSKSQTNKVEHYIDQQFAHHRELTFQDEYLRMLKKHGIAYDERFLWD